MSILSGKKLRNGLRALLVPAIIGTALFSPGLASAAEVTHEPAAAVVRYDSEEKVSLEARVAGQGAATYFSSLSSGSGTSPIGGIEYSLPVTSTVGAQSSLTSTGGVTVIFGGLTKRASFSTDSTALGTLPKDTVLYPDSYRIVNNYTWLHVKSDSDEFWIAGKQGSNDYVTGLEAVLAEIPKLDNLAAPSPTATPAVPKPSYSGPVVLSPAVNPIKAEPSPTRTIPPSPTPTTAIPSPAAATGYRDRDYSVASNSAPVIQQPSDASRGIIPPTKTPSPSPIAKVADLSNQVSVAVTDLKFRKEPSAVGALIRTLNRGDALSVTYYVTNGGFNWLCNTEGCLAGAVVGGKAYVDADGGIEALLKSLTQKPAPTAQSSTPTATIALSSGTRLDAKAAWYPDRTYGPNGIKGVGVIRAFRISIGEMMAPDFGLKNDTIDELMAKVPSIVRMPGSELAKLPQADRDHYKKIQDYYVSEALILYVVHNRANSAAFNYSSTQANYLQAVLEAKRQFSAYPTFAYTVPSTDFSLSEFHKTFADNTTNNLKWHMIRLVIQDYVNCEFAPLSQLTNVPSSLLNYANFSTTGNKAAVKKAMSRFPLLDWGAVIGKHTFMTASGAREKATKPLPVSPVAYSGAP